MEKGRKLGKNVREKSVEGVKGKKQGRWKGGKHQIEERNRVNWMISRDPAIQRG